MTINTEVYRLPFVVTPKTAAWTIWTVFGAAVSAPAVRRDWIDWTS